ncbi:MAG: cysteine protease StiP family protein [bacterium]|nr:cysteine protease StiP family protein [bacterium]
MRSTYDDQDVTILLKDITGMVAPQSTLERERLIQSGKHYSEMLPIEYIPTGRYMDAYMRALEDYSVVTAQAIGILADKIIAEKGKDVVLVSLARAGIPIGILLKRYLEWKYQIDVKHYAISIIRGRGIDHNAMEYILKRHKPETLQFVDGWIGKGAILHELEKDLEEYEGVSKELAVVADPAHMTKLCGTHEDILIPSSCLNSTVSGLISRTFLREDVIGPNDFHGAVYYGELREKDLSNQFLTTIQSNFERDGIEKETVSKGTGLEEVKKIAQAYEVSDINFIKPGIGEATRVLLRRVPWKILINEKEKENEMLRHLIQLAEEKNVSIEYYPLENYKACGIIKKIADV